MLFLYFRSVMNLPTYQKFMWATFNEYDLLTIFHQCILHHLGEFCEVCMTHKDLSAHKKIAAAYTDLFLLNCYIMKSSVNVKLKKNLITVHTITATYKIGHTSHPIIFMDCALELKEFYVIFSSSHLNRLLS